MNSAVGNSRLKDGSQASAAQRKTAAILGQRLKITKTPTKPTKPNGVNGSGSSKNHNQVNQNGSNSHIGKEKSIPIMKNNFIPNNGASFKERQSVP